MSFEGYYQILCNKGHYDTLDIYQTDEPLKEKCAKCFGKIVWYNLVDTTNGSYNDNNERIDNYIKLKVKSKKVCNKCNSTLEILYKIPRTRG